MYSSRAIIVFYNFKLLLLTCSVFSVLKYTAKTWRANQTIFVSSNIFTAWKLNNIYPKIIKLCTLQYFHYRKIVVLIQKKHQYLYNWRILWGHKIRTYVICNLYQNLCIVICHLFDNKIVFPTFDETKESNYFYPIWIVTSGQLSSMKLILIVI